MHHRLLPVFRTSLLSSCAAFAFGANLAATPTMAQETEGADALEEIIVTGSRIQRTNLTAPNPVTVVNSLEVLESGETDLSDLLREIPALNNTLSAAQSGLTADSPSGTAQLDLRGLGTERTLTLVNGKRHVAGIAGTAAVDVSSIPVALIERVEVLTGGASAIYGADAVTGVVNFILKDDFEGLDYRAQAGISDEGDGEDYFLSVLGGINLDNGRGNAVLSIEYNRSEEILVEDRDFSGLNQAFFVPSNADVADFVGVSPDALNTFAPNVRLPISSPNGIIWLQDAATGFGTGFVNLFFLDQNNNCPLVGGFSTCQIVDDSGTLRPYDPGDIFIDAFNAIGGDGIPGQPDIGFLQPQQDNVHVNGNLTYDIYEGMEFFAETKFSYAKTFDRDQVNGFNDDIPIALENPFIPGALRNQITSLQDQGITPMVTVSRDNLDVPFEQDTDRYTLRIVAGLQGDFLDNFDYEVSYNYGRTERNANSLNSRFEDRFFAAIDSIALSEDDLGALDPATTFNAVRPGVGNISVDGGNLQVGDIICRSELDPSAEPPVAPFPDVRTGFQSFTPGEGNCVPLNVFGRDTTSAEAEGFIFGTTTSNSQLTQQVVLATVSGNSAGYFELPGGPVGVALGFEYREEESEFKPDSAEVSGLLFNSVTTASAPVDGRFDVWELFGETSLPLLADLPFVEQLTVDGAVRFSDYSTIGETVTWSVGGSYTPVSDIRVRGTFSRAVRAPNIDELFSPQQPIFINADFDPCNPNFITAGTEFREENCLELVGEGFNSTNFNTAFVTGRAGGNPNLTEETADTITIGGVITPRWVPGLSLTVDYYDIRIEDAIIIVDPERIIENCVDAPTLDNEFCDLVQRDPVNRNITFFESGEQNVAALEATGIDFEVLYEFDVADLGVGDYGSVRLLAVGNKTLDRTDFEFQQFPDEADDLLGETAFPEWQVNFNARWRFAGFRFTWQTRFESSQLLVGVENEDIENDPNFVDPVETGNSFVHDLSVAYDLFEQISVYGGVNNITDRDPYLAGLVRPVGPVGRFFFAGIEGRF